MLIYLDANIVQYCADYGDFVFGREGTVQPSNRNLKKELRALGEVIELAVRAEVQDLNHRWDVAAPRHLLEELSRGYPSQEQLDTYRSLREAWQDLGIEEHGSPDIEVVNAAETRLRRLNLRDPPDRRHFSGGYHDRRVMVYHARQGHYREDAGRTAQANKDRRRDCRSPVGTPCENDVRPSFRPSTCGGQPNQSIHGTAAPPVMLVDE